MNFSLNSGSLIQGVVHLQRLSAAIASEVPQRLLIDQSWSGYLLLAVAPTSLHLINGANVTSRITLIIYFIHWEVSRSEGCLCHIVSTSRAISNFRIYQSTGA